MAFFRVMVCTEDVTPCPVASQAWVSIAEVLDLAQLGITPAEVLYVFSWGMGAVLSMWAIGYAVGAAVSALDKA